MTFKAKKKKRRPLPRNWYKPVTEVGWDMQAPCADCPFRKSTPVQRKGISDLPGLVDEMTRTGGIGHSCHMTDDRSDYENPALLNGKVQACAGFTRFAMNCGMPTPQMVSAHSRGDIDLTNLSNREDCHDLKDLLEAYVKHYKIEDVDVEAKVRNINHVCRANI